MERANTLSSAVEALLILETTSEAGHSRADVALRRVLYAGLAQEMLKVTRSLDRCPSRL